MSDRYGSWDDFLQASSNSDWNTENLGKLFRHRKEKNHLNLSLLAVTGEKGVVPRDTLERRDTSNEDKSNYLRVMPGDIVYNTMRMWQGVSGKSEYEGIVSPAYTICEPRNGMLSNYAKHLFKLPLLIQVFHRRSQGLVNDTLNLKFENFSPIRVRIPPKPEQQKIASILTSVDEVIEKTEAQISKLQDLKKGMMQELLTKGIGHTEFKDSPVGRIPKRWEVLKLGKLISSLEGGVSVNGENRPKQIGEFGVLKVSAVNNGQFRPEENKAILESDLHRARLHPQANYILFSRANTPALVGESGYIERTRMDLFLPDKLWLLDVNDRKRVNMRWLSYMLIHGSTRKAISDAATGTSGSMKNISKPNLLSISVSFPPKYEQDEIAESICSVDRRIGLASKKLKHTLALKQALMQDLLTGKVRVKVN